MKVASYHSELAIGQCLINRIYCFIFILLLTTTQTFALRHHLSISHDDRRIFKIETFGFNEGGVMNLQVSGLKIESPKSSADSGTVKLGFIMRKAQSESSAQQDLESIIETKACIIDRLAESDVFLDLSDVKTWANSQLTHEFSATEVGLYSLVFAQCQSDSGQHRVSFTADAEFTNIGPNFLSAGDIPLPSVYLIFSLLFSASLVIWIWVLVMAKHQNAIVHNIHYMMLALLVLKCLTLLFESIRYHYIAATGASELWSVVYYIFAFMKGIMLFTVILLIGSGWSLMKPYLNDREKQIIIVVLTLQVIDNIAMVILEETSPGTLVWLTWRDVLHLVDIMCCCAILFPIVWSINHLKLAAEADGKASSNLKKLTIFREFYVMVVAYIYVTRIAVYLLSASIPFNQLYLADIFNELTTLLFYMVTGYKFRPAPDNPYLPIRSEDDMLMNNQEYGLDGETDIEVVSVANQGVKTSK